ncbi:uncharacterized protein LOC116124670 [Pistacia vera]|uniref:uncharacterized protein LOC116124670 n=1 Tax=Pistacia vera TaxID=55513 RepID=UPI001263812D|nr:uncharacterized protein LOC116124670 [Pistacia vera]
MSKFEVPLFDGKINFMLWRSTIQDLLVQQGLDQALEESKPEKMSDKEWNRIQRRAVSTIRLALAPETKYIMLIESTPKGLWEKLEGIYASKSLTNRLCLKMDLYSLKMDEGRSTLKLDDVIALLCENERFMGSENSSLRGDLLVAEGSNLGRTQERDCFVELKKDENYGNIVVGNNEKVKIEGVGSVRLKLHNGVVKKLASSYKKSRDKVVQVPVVKEKKTIKRVRFSDATVMFGD